MVPFGAMNVRELLIETLAHIPPAGALEHLTADEAERRVPGANHSIAEIVAHMNFWASWFCRPVRGHGRRRWSRVPRPAGQQVAPGTWPELHRQFLSTLERAAALGAEPSRLAAPDRSSDRVSAARHLHDS